MKIDPRAFFRILPRNCRSGRVRKPPPKNPSYAAEHFGSDPNHLQIVMERFPKHDHDISISPKRISSAGFDYRWKIVYAATATK